jgi:ribonuclease D
MPFTPLPPPTYVETYEQLAALCESWARESLLGVDTESNSLHAYHERVCLVQLSTRQHDYIIDPLVVKDLSPLGVLLEDPSIEKVFHAAEYDIMCLKRDYGFTVTNLFDTMIAARICGIKLIGLNNLLEEFIGVTVDKSHQRDNWGIRPLRPDSLHYAQMDTHYLPQLRDILLEKLESEGHLVEAQEMFDEICEITPAHDGRTFDPDGFWKLGIPRGMNMMQLAVLRELYLLREEIASRRDIPPFKIFSNHTLTEMAQSMPDSLRMLHGIKGMSPGQIRRYGASIVGAIRRGRRTTLPEPPRNDPPPQEVSDRYIALHAWRKDRALQRGVESDVIVSKQTLWSLAHKAPATIEELEDIRGLGPWRLQAYGHEILNVIAEFENGR